MMKKILVVLSVLLLFGVALNAVSAETGYIEQVNRSGDKILYRLVVTNRAYSNDEKTLGYVWAKGAYHLPDAVDQYCMWHGYDFKNWSYKEYTGKRYIRYDTVTIPTN